MDIKKTTDGSKLTVAVSGRLDTNTAPQLESELKGFLDGVTDLTLDFSRMFRKSGQRPVETLSNIAVFVPFGFFLGEWLASSNRTGSWRRVGLVTLAAFGLSLCIECLQLVLHVGFFEVTDLVMNTFGGFFGGLISLGSRKVARREVMVFRP